MAPPLFWSQLVKDGEDFLLKKGPLKIHRVLDPIITSPFVVPTTRKEAPTGNLWGTIHSKGDSPLQAVTNCFPQVWGKRITEPPEVIFDLTEGNEGVETNPPNDSSNDLLSPPVRGRLHSFRRD